MYEKTKMIAYKYIDDKKVYIPQSIKIMSAKVKIGKKKNHKK